MNSIDFCNREIFPSKIVCVGRNYVEHIQELGNDIPREIVIFLKPNSAISSELLLHERDEIHYEAEITFIVKDGGLAGVGLGLDLTKRKVQAQLKAKGLPWERAKAFNNSAVFSSFVKLRHGVETLRLELYVNGVIRQSGGCSLMLHSPSSIINEVSGFLSLEDGDLIMTGTPKGVGEVMDGDLFTGKIFSDKELLVEKSWKV